MKKREAFFANWIVPVTGPSMQQAALIVENGRISAIVPGHELPTKAKNLKINHFPTGVILPAWVNAHTHLELSYITSKPSHQQFFDWVEWLIAFRQNQETAQHLQKAALEQMQKMRQNGTALVGDITNGALLAPVENAPLERVVFYEILGFLPEQADEIFQKALRTMQRQNPNAILTPHALYSVSLPLLQQIAAHSPRLTIHLAESKDEFDFFVKHNLRLQNFLKARGVWPAQWHPPGKTPLRVLEQAGALNKTTLLVHGVHVTDDDVRVIKKAKAKVCICARSNRFLNVGQPPVAKYLEQGVPMCVGTDSLASNDSLDLNDEIYYLWKQFGQLLDAVQLVRMATLNGAQALGKEAEYGSLEVGKKAAFNLFEFDEPIKQNPELAVVSRKWRRLTCF